jgi:hypothetical protein
VTGHTAKRAPAVRGQAMTELLVAASFVLVPLLLLIPLLGKYIDIRHAAIQAARYEAWEYTVWYNGTAGGLSDDRPNGYPNTLPIKTVGQTEAESMRRFFSDTALPISGDDVAGWDVADRNPLWTDHRGQALWDGTLDTATPTDHNESTPDLTGGVMSFLIDIIDVIFSALASALAMGGSSVGFTAINTDGYSISQVAAVVRVPDGVIDFANVYDEGIDASVDSFDLTFRSQAAVLTDSWNAGGLEHTTNQAGGLVPTKLLQTLIDDVLPSWVRDALDIMSIIVPELLMCDPFYNHPFDKPFVDTQDGSLWLGYMDIDAVPADRLDMDGDGARDDGRAVTCTDGVCRYDFSGATYSGPTPYTQGMGKASCDT